MPATPPCPKCLAQEAKKRHDKPHDDLKEIGEATHTKGGGMYGGGGTTTKYECGVCGAIVTHSDDKLDAPHFWSLVPAGSTLRGNGFLDWIFDRCCHEGALTLNRQKLNSAFPGDARKALETLSVFCETKGLTFTVNDADETFTFELPDP